MTLEQAAMRCPYCGKEAVFATNQRLSATVEQDTVQHRDGTQCVVKKSRHDVVEEV